MMKDKLYHFFVGAWLGFFLINISPFYGFGAVILIALGKEIVWDDWMKKGTPELWDFVFTVMGGLLIFLTKIS